MGGAICDPVGGAENGDAVDAQSRVDGEDHGDLLEVGMGSGVGADVSVSSSISSMRMVFSRPE